MDGAAAKAQSRSWVDTVAGGAGGVGGPPVSPVAGAHPSTLRTHRAEDAWLTRGGEIEAGGPR